MVRFWWSKFKVTAGHRGHESIHVSPSRSVVFRLVKYLTKCVYLCVIVLSCMFRYPMLLESLSHCPFSSAAMELVSSQMPTCWKSLKQTLIFDLEKLSSMFFCISFWFFILTMIIILIMLLSAIAACGILLQIVVWSVCLSVGHVCEPCRKDWTDWGANWSWAHVLDWVQIPTGMGNFEG